jgi:hypothetical protein
MIKSRGSQASRNSTLAEKIAFYSVKVGACTFWKHHWDHPDRPAFLRWEGKPKLVRRLVWENAHGPIPPGRPILQECGHRGCINLKHLYLGTRKGGRLGNG